MKLLSTLSHPHFAIAGILVFALSVGAANQMPLQAQTNAPAAADANVDKETGKPVVTTPSGLKYVDLAVGTGPAVKTGDHVTVKYVGRLLNGTKFDASADHGGTFDYVQGVTSLIAGWTEGTSTMKVGGKRKLIIPPQLGYGLAGAGDVIPPNATLIFEIELVAINPS
ncbi:MAG: FKBP-type peptidyl-prolyl cis-trans isomerase [Methylacidiphilales bacterium]|nr:FKBP-type peptidyl-prolyl cis-trans isomerase [Candidatus Methylacidiphilales bacterium]